MIRETGLKYVVELQQTLTVYNGNLHRDRQQRNQVYDISHDKATGVPPTSVAGITPSWQINPPDVVLDVAIRVACCFPVASTTLTLISRLTHPMPYPSRHVSRAKQPSLPIGVVARRKRMVGRLQVHG